MTDTIELALAALGCDQVAVRYKPCVLSDFGSCCVSGDLATWLKDHRRITFAVYRSARKSKARSSVGIKP